MQNIASKLQTENTPIQSLAAECCETSATPEETSEATPEATPDATSEAPVRCQLSIYSEMTGAANNNAHSTT